MIKYLVCLISMYALPVFCLPWGPLPAHFYAIDAAKIDIDSVPLTYGEPAFIRSRKAVFQTAIPVYPLRLKDINTKSNAMHAVKAEESRYFPSLNSNGLQYHKVIAKAKDVPSHKIVPKKGASIHYYLSDEISLSAAPSMQKAPALISDGNKILELHFMVNFPIK